MTDGTLLLREETFCAKFIQRWRVKGLSLIAAPSLVKHVDLVVQRDKVTSPGFIQRALWFKKSWARMLASTKVYTYTCGTDSFFHQQMSAESKHDRLWLIWQSDFKAESVLPSSEWHLTGELYVLGDLAPPSGDNTDSKNCITTLGALLPFRCQRIYGGCRE